MFMGSDLFAFSTDICLDITKMGSAIDIVGDARRDFLPCVKPIYFLIRRINLLTSRKSSPLSGDFG